GDDDLVALACRRTTFEWVLRRSALGCEGVSLLDGRDVVGFDATSGTRPTVRGVQIAERAARKTIAADLVVDASGPRGGSDHWLAASGVEEPDAEVHETGIVYFSRFYELREGADEPVGQGPVAGDLGHLKFAVFIGDNRTFSVTLAVAVDDGELRRAL